MLPEGVDDSAGRLIPRINGSSSTDDDGRVETASSSSWSLVGGKTETPFEYEALDHTADTFRLIKVLPSRSADGFLQLEIWHDAISTASYHCLSYQWGDQTDRHEILINAKRFNVGENLHSFLEEVHARSKISSECIRTLWIDSICIDQTCPNERGHQVQHMGNIYASAMGVLVWLGKQRVSDELYSWLHEPTYIGRQKSEQIREQWDSIRFNPYWYRAWIVQEILLARSVEIFLSEKSLDWKSFGRAMTHTMAGTAVRLVTGLEDESMFDENIALRLYSFWCDRWENDANVFASEDLYGDKARIASKSSGGDTQHATVWELIHMHRRAKCTDQRDRIYSLLGLLGGEKNFAVDYEESIAGLFWRAGEHFNAWDTSELVDTLRIALLQGQRRENETDTSQCDKANPWTLIDALRTKPNLQVRIPVRRAWPTTSLMCLLTKRTKCKFDECSNAPRIHCAPTDMLLCTNARSYSFTEHGCLHALAHPTDKPAAERFEFHLVAHHGKKVTTTILPPTALQVHDVGTDSWVGVSTWSSLTKALNRKDLDRADRVKLLVPAKYAVWIWFGVHPSHLDDAFTGHEAELPSAHHALPPGTKVTRDSIEVPPSSTEMTGETRTTREGVFEQELHSVREKKSG